MKSLADIEKYIENMDEEKRAKLELFAGLEDMTLIDYLIDLYNWANVQSGNTIIIKNSTTGNITQNS